MHGHPLIDRFEAQYVPVPHCGCWLWIGSADEDGYGSIYDGRGKRAHRVAWELFRGDIPHGMQVCHKCDTPACVNPDHLFIGTGLDNMRDKVRKGRLRVRHKLNPSQVNAIRLDERPNPVIARHYGINRGQVWRIKTRRAWK